MNVSPAIAARSSDHATDPQVMGATGRHVSAEGTTRRGKRSPAFVRHQPSDEHRSRTGTAVVYRMYDVRGNLLYIGSTVDLPARIKNHMTGHWQSADPDTMRALFHALDIEYHDTLEDARYAEKVAIREEGPALNRMGNPKRWRKLSPSNKWVEVDS